MQTTFTSQPLRFSSTAHSPDDLSLRTCERQRRDQHQNPGRTDCFRIVLPHLAVEGYGHAGRFPSRIGMTSHEGFLSGLTHFTKGFSRHAASNRSREGPPR